MCKGYLQRDLTIWEWILFRWTSCYRFVQIVKLLGNGTGLDQSVANL